METFIPTHFDDDLDRDPDETAELDPDCCPECGDALNVYGVCPACEM